MFWAEIWKISDFFIYKFSVFDGKIFSIFEKACFRYALLGAFPMAKDTTFVHADNEEWSD